jgi:hypothetical protein
MLSWSDIMVQQERNADLLREAERERLIQHVLAGRERRGRFTRQALAWLGQRLVAWGCRLQERYGATTGVYPSVCQPTPASR